MFAMLEQRVASVPTIPLARMNRERTECSLGNSSKTRILNDSVRIQSQHRKEELSSEIDLNQRDTATWWIH